MADSDLKRTRHLERTKLELRASYPDEDSSVIEREALSRAPKSSSTPPHAKGLVAILAMLPGWGRVVVLLALIAALAAGGLGSKLAGMW